jgi:hypothetical protein
MEGLARIVADSLARHGFDAPVDHRRLEWSRWFHCESSFSLLLVPSAAGIYSMGEEIVAPGEIASSGGKRMLAVFEIAETEDLCVALSRHLAPRSRFNERLSSGRCFVRFAQVADADQRHAVCTAINRWLTSSSEAATGISKDPARSRDIALAHDFAVQADQATAIPTTDSMPSAEDGVETTPDPAPQTEPPRLPAGF